MAKRALITGITGQDGSYLAELLLNEGYEVIGMVRRTSTVNFERLEHIQDDLVLVPGDLLDEVSLIDVLRTHRPEEVYNLAAQSFVQTSFAQPVLTGETTALGVTRVLDAIRIVDPDIRFYQASSSEMFGKVMEVPQTESTPFYPRSPYGVAKVYGHWITINYRESYGLHASSGILFNHESVPAETPIIVRRNDIIDILPIGEVVPHPTDPASGSRHNSDGGDFDVWDGAAWSRCTGRTAYWHEGEAITLHGRGGVVTTTPDHVVFTPDRESGEQEAERFTPGQHLVLADHPTSTWATRLTTQEAWLLGLLTAGGHVNDSGRVRLMNTDEALLLQAGEAWKATTAGDYRKHEGPGDPACGDRFEAVELHGNPPYGRLLLHELYCADGSKRVPVRILNAGAEERKAYLDGYCAGHTSEAGNHKNRARSFQTTSPTLAAGIVWLFRTTVGSKAVVDERPGASGNEAAWLVHLANGHKNDHEGAPRDTSGSTVQRVDRRPFTGWMFDLETSSGRFCAGVGGVVIHNSPRRGLEFVTRKISHTVAKIKLGLASELRLGNLEAQRDWGFAGDYVEAMYLMLQQDEPDNYVVSTNETHSVREFCQVAFDRVGLDYEKHVVIDEKFFRPAEVDLLVGDSSKARTTLGWEPKVPFENLVTMMVDADMKLLTK